MSVSIFTKLPTCKEPSVVSCNVVGMSAASRDSCLTEAIVRETPSSVTLGKSDGSYWGKKSFTVTISKSGYDSQIIPITAKANGWYIGGNFLFGGLIGWFIVDPLNGAMYTLSPDQITSALENQTAHNNKAEDGSISIVLVQDVPSSLRNKMKRIN